MSGKVIILMMDSFGIGGAPDAAAFSNIGANTFAHIAYRVKEYCDRFTFGVCCEFIFCVGSCQCYTSAVKMHCFAAK